MRTSSVWHIFGVGLVAVFICGVGAGCVEFDYPDDTYTCDPDSPNPCPEDFICAISPTSGDHRCLLTANPCGDGTCGAGETPSNCPADCAATCGNGVCDAGEDLDSCPADCETCGNGICDGDETVYDCPTDCEAVCGNNICDSNENVGTCPEDCGSCGDGYCDVLETIQSCVADCAVQCTPAISGSDHDFIISEIRVPASAMEADALGVDLDGDGVIDNKLGHALALFAAQGADPNENLTASIADGSFTTAGRINVDSFPTDDVMYGQLFPAFMTSPGAPLFDGSDYLTLEAWYDSGGSYLCGTMSANHVNAGPGDLLVELPLFVYGAPMLVYLSFARMVGNVNAQEWTDVMVGGGLTEEEIQDSLIPGMANGLNAFIWSDCQGGCGSASSTMMGLFDDGCDSTLPGCSAADTGTECQVNQAGVDPNPITATEIRCNSLLSGMITPDIDSDLDGIDDLLSVGWKVQAVPATLQ